METIFAVSSGAPPAAIAIVRISGPAALDAVGRLTGSVPPARQAALRALYASDGALLDRALVLVFPGPRSATGENLAELHLHGGKAVVRAVEAALAGQGLRPAAPGEFTRRALANGRIDLTEAEGLGDLLTAQTEQQRRAALAVADGALSRLIDGWTTRVVSLAARLEAEIDFSDEDDVPASSLAEMAVEAAALGEEIGHMLDIPPVERLHDGLRIVLAGPPNSGKSTLFNAMAGRDAAIVSPLAGTTRDRIEMPVARGGMAYVLTDTAGLADTPGDPIEAIGMTRAEQAMRGADLVIWLGDQPPPVDALWIHSRADLPERIVKPDGPVVAISADTGMGMAALWQLIDARCRVMVPPLDMIAMNRRQHGLALEAAEALSGCICETDCLVVAEQLRWARSAFDRLTGRADAEAMLDALFARFCIGK